MFMLITIASVLFFGNKVLLLLGKKVTRNLGWFLGSLAAILFVVYFFIINTPILSVMEIGLVILMTYRFLSGAKSNKKIEKILGIVTGFIIIILLTIANQGLITYMQFFGATGMLVGTYFLINSKENIGIIVWDSRIGWLLYGLGHLFTSYIGYQKHETIFFIFQFWQMFLCLGGFLARNQKERNMATISTIIIGIISVVVFSVILVI